MPRLKRRITEHTHTPMFASKIQGFTTTETLLDNACLPSSLLPQNHGSEAASEPSNFKLAFLEKLARAQLF